jgi:hypothetical protein
MSTMSKRASSTMKIGQTQHGNQFGLLSRSMSQEIFFLFFFLLNHFRLTGTYQWSTINAWKGISALPIGSIHPFVVAQLTWWNQPRMSCHVFVRLQLWGEEWRRDVWLTSEKAYQLGGLTWGHLVNFTSFVRTVFYKLVVHPGTGSIGIEVEAPEIFAKCTRVIILIVSPL